MLEARDELRHPHNDDHFWRESLYFNFADEALGIGGWVYLWVLPNQELKSGMLCSLYKGIHPDPETSTRAQANPDHIERTDDGRWMYFFSKNVPELLEADFDDVELCGLRLRRLDPLKRYSLQYVDDAGNGFDLNGSFLTLPYDYGDHPNPTPDWMAANRYHRAWQVEGTLKIGGETLRVNTTGDSDHSWGRRHGGNFMKFNFKMWSAQVKPDFAFSVVTMGEMGQEIPYGFLAREGRMHPVVRVAESGKYDADGVQRTVQMDFEDDTGHVVRGSAEMFASIAAGTPGAYWGHEGGARYSLEGVGETTGIVSYFWPASVQPDSMPGMTSPVLPLDSASAELLRLVGGKAASLGELRRTGFVVPDGFCITTEAIGERDSLLPEGEEEVLAAYRGLASPLVAVRSSAVEEDGFEHSLAGAYATALNVEGEAELLGAIQECIRAYHTDAARQLREKMDAGGLALVVQPMAAAIAAGVLFTANPVNGHLGESVVSAIWGLGEPLVSGRVAPDEFVVRRSDGKVLSQTIGEKTIPLLAGHGNREGRPSEKARSSPALKREQLAELVALGERVEEHFGFPQDIEWALTEDGFVLLQARPIPTLAAAYYNRKLELWAGNDDAGEASRTLWSRAYSDEIWTKPTSPLFYTTHNLSGTFAWYFGTVGNTARLPEAVFRYHRAAAYVDVKYLEEQMAYQPRFARTEGLLNLLPPERREAARRAPWRWRGRLRQVWALERSPGRAQSVFRVHRLVKAQWPAWLEVVARWRKTDIAELSDDALLAHLAEVHAESAKVGMPCAVGVLFHGYDLTLLLQGLLERWLPDRPDAFAALTSGLDDSETVAEAHAIRRLSRLALEDSEVCRAVTELNWRDLRAQSDQTATGRRLLEGIEAFLAGHYHRGANYKDVIWPRWGDDPGLFISTLRMYLEASMEDPAVVHDRQCARRRNETSAMLSDLRRRLPLGPLKELALRAVLKYAQIYLAHRDNHRFYYDHSHWEVRRSFRELGARLAACGALDAQDEVFFLGQDEVTGALKGDIAAAEALRRARVRKRWFENADPLGSPRFLRGEQPIEEEAPSQAGESRRLTGIAASSGIATGVARVVLNVTDLGRVGQGDVLVASQTDPGWTPVFSRMGALVMETGSVLAHGTTLCREYGLPAVTAVEGATRRIRDGDLVTVDGTRGSVTVVERPA